MLQIDLLKDMPGKLGGQQYDVIVADLSTLGRINWPSRRPATKKNILT